MLLPSLASKGVAQWAGAAGLVAGCCCQPLRPLTDAGGTNGWVLRLALACID